jgi:hypothetical protein
MALLYQLVLLKCHEGPFFLQPHHLVPQLKVLLFKLISFSSKLLYFLSGLSESFKAML